MAKEPPSYTEEEMDQQAEHLAATFEYWILQRRRKHRYFHVFFWKTLQGMRKHLANKAYGCLVHYPGVTLKNTRRSKKIGEIHLCVPHLQADVICHEVGHAVRLYARLCKLKSAVRSVRDEERFCGVLGDMCIELLRAAAQLVPQQRLLAWKRRR